MIDITLLGTGGMYPLPERALTSLYVRFDGRYARGEFNAHNARAEAV